MRFFYFNRKEGDVNLEIRQVGQVLVLKADEGKHFENKEGLHVGIELWLGNGDHKENYTEVENEKVQNG